MRLVVEVPDKKLEQFKSAVEAQNRTQADVIRAAIDQFIRSAKNGSRAKDDSPSGQEPEPEPGQSIGS